jgi:hypothetical protein
VLKQIEQREKHGVYTHILAFHELSTTTAMMPELITELKGRGYRFVTLSEYMQLVGAKQSTSAEVSPIKSEETSASARKTRIQ